MPERMRKPAEEPEAGLDLEGMDQFFDQGQPSRASRIVDATVDGVHVMEAVLEKLTGQLTDLVGLSVDQRVETAKITNQLIDNQRQLIATQQILIRLMEKSIELTRHITAIEEKLPVVFTLPKLVEDLRAKVAHLEGVEIE